MQTFAFLKLRRILRVNRILLGQAVRLAWRRLLPSNAPADGPQRLQQSFEKLGGTFIKFGQVLSLQPDALPVEYCNALFNLLDKVPPFAYPDAHRTFIEDLGASPEEIFDHFDAKPIASASIGQVYFAELGGQKLAVKVRRPTVEADFAADILMMSAVARMIEVLHLSRWQWLARSLREFCSWTHEELDYRYEARFMSALGYNAKDNQREEIPDLLADYSTARILVAERMQGPMVLDYIRAIDDPNPALAQELDALRFDREEFARNLVSNFVSDAFQYGLFHADLHPANLFILADNTVGYVDFGITGSLSPHSRRSLVSMTLAVTRADLDGMMLHFRAIADTDDEEALAIFRNGLGELLNKWYDLKSSPPVLQTSFSVVMMDILKLSKKSNVWATPDVIRYFRSVITADGLINRFAPNLDVGQHLENVCREYLQQSLWREWLSLEHLADISRESVELLEKGPNAALHSQAAASRCHEQPHRANNAVVILLGLMTAVFTALAAYAGTTPVWGWNLFSAQATLAFLSGAALLWQFRRSS